MSFFASRESMNPYGSFQLPVPGTCSVSTWAPHVSYIILMCDEDSKPLSYSLALLSPPVDLILDYDSCENDTNES